MTKPKKKVAIITCPVCGIKYRHQNNITQHNKSRYHKVVKFYKKAMNDLIQKHHLKDSDVNI